jgi:hypothetical protein
VPAEEHRFATAGSQEGRCLAKALAIVRGACGLRRAGSTLLPKWEVDAQRQNASRCECIRDGHEQAGVCVGASAMRKYDAGGEVTLR